MASLPAQPNAEIEARHTALELADALTLLSPAIEGTRFAAYRDALRTFVESKRLFSQLDLNEQPMVRHSFAEAQEFMTIATCLVTPPELPTFRSEMRRLLDGPVTPRSAMHYIELPGSAAQAAECNDTTDLRELVRQPIDTLRTDGSGEHPEAQTSEEAPRNAAFELYLACLFKRNGVAPVKAEPDWIIPADNAGRVGLAAKRIQSFGALYGKVDEAAAQIERAVRSGNATTGIVAVDLTLPLDLHRKHWVIRQSSESIELRHAVGTEEAAHQARILSALDGRANVTAVLLHAKAFIFNRESQSFLTTRSIIFAALPRATPGLRAWMQQMATT